MTKLLDKAIERLRELPEADQGAIAATLLEEIDDQDSGFLMANLYPSDTGLPMVVWISERDHARHDVRVKVALSPGERVRPDNTVSVSLRPDVEVVAGSGLSTEDLRVVREWVLLNGQNIIDYWDSRISTRVAFDRLLPLGA